MRASPSSFKLKLGFNRVEKNISSNCMREPAEVLRKASMDCRLIVLTGGPGSGKTKILKAIKEILCDRVVILPEAAGIVFGGGFWRLESKNGRLASQRAISSIQIEMENLVLGENRWMVGLCDRGLLDGLAYWRHWEGEEKFFWDAIHSDLDSAYARYDTVIHLKTPSEEFGYNYVNPLRTETAEEAAVIDEKISKVWRAHPNYYEVASEPLFKDKLEKTFGIIKANMPECCESFFS